MPRKPRFTLPGYPQHVILRGNDRNACFFAPSDRMLFLEQLAESARRYQVEVHAYVLMTNHVHLLLTPQSQFGISHAIQRLGQRYVQTINKLHLRTGTLWEGRFRSSLVQSDHYLLSCMRYIELNPVRAAMVAHPAQHPWSSYHANGHGEPSSLITPHPVYAALGDTTAARLAAYRKLFEVQCGDGELGLIRDSLNGELVLGSDRYRAQIEAMTRRQASQRPRGRPRKREIAGVY